MNIEGKHIYWGMASAERITGFLANHFMGISFTFIVIIRSEIFLLVIEVFILKLIDELALINQPKIITENYWISGIFNGDIFLEIARS